MLDKNTITFFTYESLGFMRLTGNVYSEVNPRCPAADDDSDFAFGALETQIKLETIKSKMEINEMS